MSGPTPETAEGKAIIENKAQLVAYFDKGLKPKSEWRIGTEHEKFPFLTDTLEPVPYFGQRSIRSLLEGLKARFGWDGVYEGENIIALSDPKGMANISLEPGGQFELSGAPVETVHQTQAELMAHLAQVREIATPLGDVAFRYVERTGDYGRFAPGFDTLDATPKPKNVFGIAN